MSDKIKRVLWLTRANYCHNFRIDWYLRRHPHTNRTQAIMENTLIIAEMKCRHKAKEVDKCCYCENPSGPSCNSPICCGPYEAQVIHNNIHIQTTDDQAVSICTIRGIRFCPMCGRGLTAK